MGSLSISVIQTIDALPGSYSYSVLSTVQEISEIVAYSTLRLHVFHIPTDLYDTPLYLSVDLLYYLYEIS